ncbi:L-aspartate oxidase [Achromobacter sp. Marseille-Q0513]|uniref:L-aspartate oxidase n=1 Tax=Achromobacter sp. Marseille-Q0513 TaxID=2829161 RepID=UPI001B924653|nr:L-aspartate oxidase [Achromobacter sp. Marseille-Q0513]MBR8651880.1 L-aspartate oxidase [Achromobacter sp. Marseille-Q0513]
MHPESTDVLVIGAGLAGMATALSLPPHLRVTMLSKGPADDCASAWAQGGIAAAQAPDDSIEAHVQDTLIAGAGLCDADAVRRILAQGPAAIDWLLGLGVPFTLDEDGRSLHLTREGGHGARRIAHAADATGRAVHAALLRQCRARPNIRLIEHAAALDLLLAESADAGAPRRCLGARVRVGDGAIIPWEAGHTVLATGGLGQVYAQTTNPDAATGDGVAMAWRAGCQVADMEFVQFHPTALQVDGRAAGLVTEALRGEGAVLRLPGGERFMPAHDSRAELAPRDIVARAIWAEMSRGDLPYVHLDISHRPRAWLDRHFPAVTALCAAHGIDIATQPMPVAPCAHYACGGVRADVDGATGIAGLRAVGEVARTGLHGANRLASNSLLECVVMGRAAARAIAASGDATNAGVLAAPSTPRRAAQASTLSRPAARPAPDAPRAPDTIRAALRRLMQREAGIVRSDQGLAGAAEQIATWRRELPPDADPAKDARWQALRNQLDVCDLIVAAAARRRESRGAHASSDWPAPGNAPGSP